MTSFLTLTLEEQFEELNKATEKSHNSRPKIQKVAGYLRNRKDFSKHYSPKLVSIGPIHHGTENLQVGEQYKRMWAKKYIDSTELTAQTLHKRIVDNIEELKKLFADDVLSKFEEKQLSMMLFVDGCALLHIMKKAKLHEPGEMKVKVDQLVLVMIDVLLLENQLPYHVLKMLWKDENEVELMKIMKEFLKCHHWANKSDEKQNQRRMRRKQHVNKKNEEDHQQTVVDVELHDQNHPDNEDSNIEEQWCAFGIKKAPVHLLDFQRSIILLDSPHPKTKRNEANYHKKLAKQTVVDTEESSMTKRNEANYHKKIEKQKEETEESSMQTKRNEANYHKKLEKQKEETEESSMVTYRNIQELKAAGITLESSKTRRPRDVSFSHGWFNAELTLPEIVVDDTTASTFLNLIAYEMCPDFNNDYGVCSFAAFMDSLIDHPEDVKALRSARILLNSLGSDEEVANLFNIISTDLVPNNLAYASVRGEIEEHYRDRWKTWIALGFHTYFSNPWAIIAFLAAILALALTFVQTWFAIHPPNN